MTNPDGIHARVPREQLTESARRFRDAYDMVPGAPLYRKEFWLMPGALERWKNEGMPQDVPQHELFGYDGAGSFGLGRLGWCEAALAPTFEEKIIEDRGDHEIAQDYAGRHVLFFKNQRVGFMPEYVAHPVKDQRTWEEDVLWRLDPTTPERWADFDQHAANAVAAAGEGLLISQGLIGGYMYLRSLIGPVDLLYTVHDNPKLIHACMTAWLDLADAVAARHQQHVTIEEVFFAEDICYNHGSLISPDMMREFLLPYYQQLIANIKRRNLDQTRRVFVQVDTDGFCDPVIPLYREAHGLDMMSPFEVASGCDVVRTAQEYPDLVMLGGMDKRVLAKTKADIDAMVERIVPTMRERGGYIPTIDHGTPEETPYENYVHYRKRMLELGG
jgi:uroporphyrinogen decarboxylase